MGPALRVAQAGGFPLCSAPRGNWEGEGEEGFGSWSCLSGGLGGASPGRLPDAAVSPPEGGSAGGCPAALPHVCHGPGGQRLLRISSPPPPLHLPPPTGAVWHTGASVGGVGGREGGLGGGRWALSGASTAASPSADNDIGDAGAQALAEALKGNSALQTLDLQG